MAGQDFTPSPLDRIFGNNRIFVIIYLSFIEVSAAQFLTKTTIVEFKNVLLIPSFQTA